MINPTGYKESYKTKRTVAELTDQELQMAWWVAFYRDETDAISCDASLLRSYLLERLGEK